MNSRHWFRYIIRFSRLPIPLPFPLLPKQVNKQLTSTLLNRDNGNATLTLLLSGDHVGKSTGSLYVYDSSSQDVLEEVDFNLCSAGFLVKGKCPLTGPAEGVLEFSTFGMDLWSIDLGIDIFSKNTQIMCVYGQAAPRPKDEVLELVQQAEEL